MEWMVRNFMGWCLTTLLASSFSSIKSRVNSGLHLLFFATSMCFNGLTKMWRLMLHIYCHGLQKLYLPLLKTSKCPSPNTTFAAINHPKYSHSCFVLVLFLASTYGALYNHSTLMKHILYRYCLSQTILTSKDYAWAV